MLKFVFKIFPVWVRYVDPEKDNIGGFAGRCYGPYIKIKKSYRDDNGLLEHELTHSRQVYRSCFLMGLCYLISSKFRYNAELEAYAVQLSYAEDKDRDRLAGLFAGFIADKYNLKVNRDKTKQELLNYEVK